MEGDEGLLLTLNGRALRIRGASSLNQRVWMSSKGKGGRVVDSKYSSTVFLPQTSFDQRSNSIQKEPAMQR
eukprot:gene47678-58411_t